MAVRTSRAALRTLAVAVLTNAATLAGDAVRAISEVPATSDAMPILYVQVPHEKKTSLTRARPLFTAMMTLVVVGRVQGTNALQVQADLDQLVDQVQDAIIGSYDLLRVVQQFSEVETSAVVTSEAKMRTGEFSTHFHCELFQRYEPPLGEPLLDIDIKIQRSGHPAAEADIVLDQTIPASP